MFSHMIGAGQIDIDHAVPVFRAHHGNYAVSSDAGIAYQDINGVEFLLHHSVKSFHFIKLGHIASVKKKAPLPSFILF